MQKNYRASPASFGGTLPKGEGKRLPLRGRWHGAAVTEEAVFCKCKNNHTIRKGAPAVNRYDSLRKPNTGRAPAVVSLALCVVLSATVLFSRLMSFTPADTQHYIPLTKSSGMTAVREGRRQSDGSITFRHAGYHPDNHRLLTARPGFRVYDENTVWQGETDIEIFRISYRNGAGQVTVRSENGEKIIAPGTENTYRFTLENTGNVALDYTLQMEAWFGEAGDANPTTIPVLARVTDYKGNYLAGSAGAKDDVLALNRVSQKGSLSKGYTAPYTLEWEWPFEGDDAYDTLLGNLATDEDITLTIRISTTATYNPTPGGDSGIPKTGDTGGIELAFAVMSASSAALLLLLCLPRRKRREHHG